MKLFFGLTLISFVFSFTVENDCSLKGPSYWCQSKSTAIKCQATNYCENHVWLKGKSTKEVDLCATCKQEVNMLHAFIEKNETYVMIMSFLKQECDMFPSSVRDACNSIVGVYSTKIIEYIVMTTSDAQASCTQFGLCTDSLSFIDAKKDLMLDGTDYCLTCQQYVGTLHLIISNKGTKDEIISELKNSCSLVQNEAYKQICTVLVDTFASKAFDWLIDYTGRPISFCTLLQLCKASFIPLVRGVPMINEFGLSMKNSDLVINMVADVMLKAQKEVKQTQPNSVSHKDVSPKSVSCELCTLAMSSLVGILKGNETKAEVKQALEQVCAIIPASLKSECDQLVDTYSDKIVDLIVAELSDPNAICKEIGLCASKIKKVMTKSMKQDVKQGVKQGVTCELCTMVIKSLEGILEGNETKAEIKQALEKVCGLIPSVKSECDQLVDSYSDEIVDLIIELANPDSICKLIGLCTSQVNKVEQIQPKGVSCELCTMAMSSLVDILKGNETKAEVKQALEKVCGILPASLKSECDQLVDTYSDKIVDLIVAELSDPNAICKQIGLCTSKINKVMTKTEKQGVKQSSQVIKVKQTQPKDDSCELCTMAMSSLEDILKGNETKAEVKQALEQVCGLLPASLKSECDQLVDTYSDQIIDLIVAELSDPNAVCKQLGLCVSKVNIQKVNHDSGNGITCDFCQYAMGKLDAILTDNATEAEIKQAVENLCAKFPSAIAGECKILIDLYGDMIISMLAQELKPSVICQALGLCTEKMAAKFTKLKIKHFLAMRQEVKGVSCSICEYAMGYLDKELETKKVETEIEQEIQVLCKKLPSAFSNECDALITEYGDDLIKLVVEQIKPAEVCKVKDFYNY
ncbi:prosaposin isoform X5 [Hydra vulgaris]|uniref:prosaposin isoform X5 n=1 Tax=Hydra vulgaris TaxID=6087 RepID=UPI0032E9E8C8